MTDDKRIDPATGTELNSHEWDGIRELNTPLPRWWLWTFYACIVFAIGYAIAYPAIPLLNGATKGVLGWSSRGDLRTEMARADAARAGMRAALIATPIDRIPPDSPLMHAAIEGGRAAFKVNCVQCHGSGAAGSIGFPNLNDDDWLWGGDRRTLEQTITHGVRQPGDQATRVSQMPSFGRDEILKPTEVEDVVSHVRTLSHLEASSASSRRGAVLFAANCAVCHGPDGKGNRKVGAPNLTDAIWLYGSDRAAILATVTNAHAGVMPAWGNRLDPATVRMLALYVHSLGGGE